jgi:rod shape-determining protein MreC
LPGRIGDDVRDDTATRAKLSDENRVLRNALLISGARLARLQAAAAENGRLRGLLGAGQRGGLDVQLAPILDVDLDPTRQRLLLDSGSRDGVQVGQTVIDAGGLIGQIIGVMPGTATVLLITDPDHAVPVQVARTGLRTIAYGTGRVDELTLPNVPQSADVRVGDRLITSGIGGRFPAGFPVGTVYAVQPDATRLFLVAQARPAAHLDRGLEVLLVGQLPAVTDAGPPVTKRPPRPPPKIEDARTAPLSATTPAAPPAAEPTR